MILQQNDVCRLFNTLWWKYSENWACWFSPYRKLWEIPLLSSRWHDLGYHWIKWLIKIFFRSTRWVPSLWTISTTVALIRFNFYNFSNNLVDRVIVCCLIILINIKRQRSLKEANPKILSVLTRQPKSCLCIVEVVLRSQHTPTF